MSVLYIEIEKDHRVVPNGGKNRGEEGSLQEFLVGQDDEEATNVLVDIL